MQSRPLVLLGAEKAEDGATSFEQADCYFDSSTGVWKTPDGRYLVDSMIELSTIKTATREAMDQPDTGLVSMMTRTSEAMDQQERSFPSTLLTKTREGIDQSERVGE